MNQPDGETAEAGTAPPPSSWQMRIRQAAPVIILILGAIFFRGSFEQGNVLRTTDDNLGALVSRKDFLQHGFKGYWSDSELLGDPLKIAEPSLRNLVLKYLPAEISANYLHLFYLCVASFFLFLYLRSIGLSGLAPWLGILTAFWCGTNLTLVSAGHKANNPDSVPV